MIADTLRNTDRWCAWRMLNGSKIPFRHDEFKAATILEPSGWTTYENAVLRAARNIAFAGVGIFIDSDLDSIVCLDFDVCAIQAGKGMLKIDPWAKTILDAVCTYTEVSPSGIGVKAFVKTPWPVGVPVSMAIHRNSENVMHRADPSGRAPTASILRRSFATLTGKRLKQYPSDVRTFDCSPFIQGLWDSAGAVQQDIESTPIEKVLTPAPPLPQSVSESIRRLRKCPVPEVRNDGSRLLYWLCANCIDLWQFEDEKILKVVKHWHEQWPIPKLLQVPDIESEIQRAILHKRGI